MTPTRTLSDQLVAGLPGTVASGAGRPVGDGSSSLRVGIDLVSVSDVVDSVGTFGDRYVRRIFTAHEIDYCRKAAPTPGSQGSYSYQSLAALRGQGGGGEGTEAGRSPSPSAADIEVHSTGGGWTEIRLSGRAAVLAAEAGIEGLAVESDPRGVNGRGRRARGVPGRRPTVGAVHDRSARGKPLAIGKEEKE